MRKVRLGLVAVLALSVWGVSAVSQVSAVEQLMLTLSEDATLNLRKPDRNYNTTVLEVDASLKKDILLKFQVTGVAARSVVQ